MSGSEIGDTSEVWAVKGEHLNGKLNMDVPASVVGLENQSDTSGHL